MEEAAAANREAGIARKRHPVTTETKKLHTQRSSSSQSLNDENLAIVPHASVDHRATQEQHSLAQWYQAPSEEPSACTVQHAGLKSDCPFNARTIDAAIPDCTFKIKNEVSEKFKKLADMITESKDLPGDFPHGKIEYPTMCGAYCKSSLDQSESKVAHDIETNLNLCVSRLGGFRKVENADAVYAVVVSGSLGTTHTSFIWFAYASGKPKQVTSIMLTPFEDAELLDFRSAQMTFTYAYGDFVQTQLTHIPLTAFCKSGALVCVTEDELVALLMDKVGTLRETTIWKLKVQWLTTDIIESSGIDTDFRPIVSGGTTNKKAKTKHCAHSLLRAFDDDDTIPTGGGAFSKIYGFPKYYSCISVICMPHDVRHVASHVFMIGIWLF